jgi:Shikimate kinase
MRKNIVLVGFMGAGKTVVGRELAKQLNLKFVDLDSQIESREKRPISEIFSQNGEPYFRKIEKEIVKEASQGEAQVIACGGGAVLDQQNLENLRLNGTLIYLKTSADVIFERTKGYKHRPLLEVAEPKKKVEELLKISRTILRQSRLYN